jgi:hypothetical protein
VESVTLLTTISLTDGGDLSVASPSISGCFRYALKHLRLHVAPSRRFQL